MKILFIIVKNALYTENKHSRYSGYYKEAKNLESANSVVQ